jgi:hypothetical protein
MATRFTDPVIKDLRTIESAFDPIYQADQDLITWKGEWDVTDSLLLTYLGSHNESSVKSIEDYNKVAPTVAFNAAGIPLGNPALAGSIRPSSQGEWCRIRNLGYRTSSGHLTYPAAAAIRTRTKSAFSLTSMAGSTSILVPSRWILKQSILTTILRVTMCYQTRLQLLPS